MDKAKPDPDKDITADKQTGGEGKGDTPSSTSAEPNDGTKPSGNCHCCCDKNAPPKEESAWRKAGTIAEVLLAIALAVATGVNAYYVGQQWGAMERTLGKTNDLVEKAAEQAEAAKQGAAAAVRAADAAQRSVEIGEEAILTAEISGPDHIAEGENSFIATLHNIGKTVATDVTPLIIDARIMAIGDSPELGLIDEDSHRFRNVNPEVADRNIGLPYYTASITLKSVQVPTVERRTDEGRALVYTYGIIRYWNGFRCKRFSFCKVYIPKAASYQSDRPVSYRGLGDCEFSVDDKEGEEPKEKCHHFDEPTMPDMCR
jgi:hypothetical protein